MFKDKFANISYHPVCKWGRDQIQAASNIAPGGVIDIEFPRVNPYMNEQEVSQRASDIIASLDEGVSAAMVQGEYSLTLELIPRLQTMGIDCYIAALERGYIDLPNGGRRRPFVQFRKVAIGGNGHGN